MDFRLSELQQLLRANAEAFCEGELTIERLRETERIGEADQALWSQIVELGWPALPLDEQYGGQGGAILDSAVLLEQLCRAAAITPFAPTLLGALAIQRLGDEQLRSAVLPEVARGATIAVALLEASDDLFAAPATRVDGSGLHGEKRFVEYGAGADLHLASAQRDGTPGLAIVRGTDGVQAAALANIGGTPLSIVTYDAAPVIGWIAGAEALTDLRALGMAITAFESYAYAQKALDMTVDYVQMRVQFGQPIGAFQAVQNRVADMATIVEGARFLTHELLWNIGEGTLDPDQAALVKAITAQMGPQVAMDCHLLHGGIGYMQEYNLQFYTRRAKDASLRWGSTREMINRVADAVLAS